MAKLLLVDDDSQLRSGLARFLRRSGFEVLEAETCAEARSLQVAETPDLTIVDYELPDGTAFDILNFARERESTEAIIVMTGLGTIDLAVQAIKLGAEHFTTKPVDQESLVILVRRTLDSQQRHRQNDAARALTARDARHPFIGVSKKTQRLQ